MPLRTTETTITFQHPFELSTLTGPQPAGTYRLVTDDEELPGLTHIAYHRVATMLHTPALTGPAGREEVHLVSAADLARALDADTH
ncbi:hypothetical protein [Flaviflagellibacter deserti]|jgi:hypothetical protein|uniref:Uncharacterized protein n=1 Tax=Flaviflagellibacter deserti TaxID=2267266 RepID=A0ABV9Z3M7_9HYPH